jgi:hypothetical protein
MNRYKEVEIRKKEKKKERMNERKKDTSVHVRKDRTATSQLKSNLDISFSPPFLQQLILWNY